MRMLRFAIPALVASLASTAPAAWADVSAEDVWESWKAMAARLGQTLDVESERAAGDALTLTGVTTTFASPEGEATATLSEIVLSDLGDGTVSIAMPAEYPFTFSASGPDDEAVEAKGRILQGGLAILASGDPGAIGYDYTAPSIGIVIDEVVDSGEAMDFDLTANLSLVEGSYRVEEGSPQSIASAFVAEALSVTFAAREANDGPAVNVSVTMRDIENTSTGTFSPLLAGQDLTAALRAGGTASGVFTTGGSDYSVNVADPETPFTLSGTGQGGRFEMDLSPEAANYTGTSTGAAMELQLHAMPFPPFNFEIAEMGHETSLPIDAATEPGNFGMKLSLLDLAIGESAWSMIDAAGQLPRDPASLVLDLSGEGTFALDLTDPEAAAQVDPFEVAEGFDSLAINRLSLAVLGAELNGSGGFTFESAGPMPMPVGGVSFELIGGNAAIDALVRAGLLPEEQAMGARMMLGLFARPGSGPDTLLSDIEVKADGSVLANGQRIR